MIGEHFYSVRKKVMLLLTIDDISIILLMNSDDTVIVRFFKRVFYRSTFVGSAWSFGVFIPATKANDLRL